MNRRSSLGFLLFIAIVAVLTYVEVPSWHGGEGAIAVLPPAAPASPAPASTTPAGPASAATDIAPSPASPATEVAAVNPAVVAPAPETAVMPGPAAGPSFDVVRVEPTGEAVVAGRSEPKASVELLDGNAPIATAKSDDTGAWALSLDKPLAPGSHDLGLRATSEDKATATLSDERVTVSVPDKGSKDVLVVMNSPDAPSKVMQVPDAGGAMASATPEPPITTEAPIVAENPPAAEAPIVAEPPVVAAAPVVTEPPVVAGPVAAEAPVAAEPAAAAPATAAPAGPQVATVAPATSEPSPPLAPKPDVVVGAVEADTSGSLYVGGTTTTGDTVRVYLNDQPLGDSKPTAAGTWLVQANRDLPAGKYTVRADQVDTEGKVVARSEVPFEREVEVADLKPSAAGGTGQAGATGSGQVAMETVIIKRGDNLWRIARGAWGNGFRWTTIYQANTDQIRNPHWIYPGQVFIMPKGDAGDAASPG